VAAALGFLLRQEMHSARATPSGFWGPPTASVDWCEANYAVNHYVAEWWNALSSLPLVALGVFGLWLHRTVLERHFLVVFACVALVGLGSTAFHGTLLFQVQMLDELPMLYTATSIVYLLLEGHAKRVRGRWLHFALLIYLLVATLGAVATRGAVQSWFFQVTFTLLEFLGLYLTYRIYRTSRAPDQRRTFRVGMTLYFGAVTAWFFDFRYCDELVAAYTRLGLPNLQLHALWHLLVAGGLYALILVIAYQRLLLLGRAPYVERRGLVVRLRARADVSRTAD
jgi:dihydroceramidase